MYILKISNTAFVRMDNDAVAIISEPENATRYPTIGNAMRVASHINNKLNSFIVRVLPVY